MLNRIGLLLSALVLIVTSALHIWISVVLTLISMLCFLDMIQQEGNVSPTA